MIWPGRDELRDASPGDHQDQRRDERLDPDHGNENAVPQAAEHGEPEGGGDGEQHRPEAVLILRPADQQAGAGSGDGGDGADREIDPPGRDHERHAESDEHQRVRRS